GGDHPCLVVCSSDPMISAVTAERLETSRHSCLPAIPKDRLVPLLDLPEHVLERAERQERIKATLVLLGKRTDLPVTRQQRLPEGGEVRPMLEGAQRHGQIVEPVAVAAVVEVNRADLSSVKEGVPMVQVGVNEPKD